MSKPLLEALARHRVVPISGVLNATNADKVADALIAGGLPLLEITLRSEGALAAVAKLARRGDMLISTGTVLTLDQAKASRDAGVSYLVAPGLDLKIVEWAQANDILMVPGTTTATEITAAYNVGLRTLKFFPAQAAGGVAAIDLFTGAFAGVKFLPTGGIAFDMLQGYLASPNVLAVGQGAMVKPEWIKAGEYHRIEAETRRVVNHVAESAAATTAV